MFLVIFVWVSFLGSFLKVLLRLLWVAGEGS